MGHQATLIFEPFWSDLSFNHITEYFTLKLTTLYCIIVILMPIPNNNANSEYCLDKFKLKQQLFADHLVAQSQFGIWFHLIHKDVCLTCIQYLHLHVFIFSPSSLVQFSLYVIYPLL